MLEFKRRVFKVGIKWKKARFRPRVRRRSPCKDEFTRDYWTFRRRDFWAEQKWAFFERTEGWKWPYTWFYGFNYGKFSRTLLSNYWAKRIQLKQNPIQFFFLRIIHYFRVKIPKTPVRWVKQRKLYIGRQYYWYNRLHGFKRIPVLKFALEDWFTSHFEWENYRTYFTIFKQILPDNHFRTLSRLHTPRMVSKYKRIKRGYYIHASYLLRGGSRKKRRRRDIVKNPQSVSARFGPIKTRRRLRIEKAYRKKPWYDKQSLVQYTENYPNNQVWYNEFDYLHHIWRRQMIYGECYRNSWYGNFSFIHRGTLALPGYDRFPFDMDSYGLDQYPKRGKLQRQHDKLFRRVSLRSLMRFHGVETRLEDIEDEFSNELWEESVKWFLEDQNWALDLDRMGGYDVDDEFEEDLIERYIIFGVATRRYYKLAMRWIRLDFNNRRFKVLLKGAIGLYLLFFMFTVSMVIDCFDVLTNMLILLGLAIIATFF